MSHPNLYDRILQMIDEELDCLLQARKILIVYTKETASKPGKPKPGLKRQRRPVAVAEIPVPEIKAVVHPPAPSRQRRARTQKVQQPEPCALTSRIPSSPVAVAPSKDVQAEERPAPAALPLSDFGARILAEERILATSHARSLTSPGTAALTCTDTSK